MIPGADGPATVHRPGGGEHRGRGVVRRGQRRDALRDLRGPGRAAGDRAGAARRRCRRCGRRSARPVTRKVDQLSCVRFGSARYSVPNRLIGAHGRACIVDGRLLRDHRAGRPARSSPTTRWSRRVRRRSSTTTTAGRGPTPRRAARPRTAAEKAFCALGPVAEAFLTGAAAAGNTRLAAELGRARSPCAPPTATRRLLAALERAVAFGRWRAADVRSILAAGGRSTAAHARPGTPWCSTCPRCRPGRCTAYAHRTVTDGSDVATHARRRWPPT